MNKSLIFISILILQMILSCKSVVLVSKGVYGIANYTDEGKLKENMIAKGTIIEIDKLKSNEFSSFGVKIKLRSSANRLDSCVLKLIQNNKVCLEEKISIFPGESRKVHFNLENFDSGLTNYSPLTFHIYYKNKKVIEETFEFKKIDN